MEGEWIELQDREPIEKALLQAYEINLTQAKDTPCMIFPLSNILGSCGETEGARIILKGQEYDRSGIDVATQVVLTYVALKTGSMRRT